MGAARADDTPTPKKFNLAAELVPKAAAANKAFEFSYVLTLQQPISRFNESMPATVSLTSSPKVACATSHKYDGAKLTVKASCVGPKGRVNFKLRVGFWYRLTPLMPYVPDSASTELGISIG